MNGLDGSHLLVNLLRLTMLFIDLTSACARGRAQTRLKECERSFSEDVPLLQPTLRGRWKYLAGGTSRARAASTMLERQSGDTVAPG